MTTPSSDSVMTTNQWALMAQSLSNELVESTDNDWVLDTIIPGQPLVISFAFVDWEKRPQFDFFGRTKKLEITHQRPFNKLFLRDRCNNWYQRGVPGLGSSVDSTINALTSLIELCQPSKIITIGQSMGGYGAILYGTLLGVNQIVAFGPLSTIEVETLSSINDRRYISQFQRLYRPLPDTPYFDLLPVLAQSFQTPTPPQLDIYQGSFPSDLAGYDMNAGSVHADSFHALRLSFYPYCRVHRFPTTHHLIVPFLVENHKMDALLAHYVFDQPYTPFDEADKKALAEALDSGTSPQEMVQRLLQAGLELPDLKKALAPHLASYADWIDLL